MRPSRAPVLLVLPVVGALLAGMLVGPVLSHPAPTPVVAQASIVPVEVTPAPLEVVPRHLAPARPSRHRALGPSGLAMPRGNPHGWRQTLAEDFSGTRLPAGWVAYSGRPGGNPHGWWDRAHVMFGGSKLRLTGSWSDGRFHTGGVMAWGARSTYGRYQVRFRVQPAPGVSYALLLWPSHGGWPSTGEIDFAEDGGGNRHSMTATLHHGSGNHLLQRHLGADFSRWRTVGVDWQPGRLVYTLDGRPWATVRSSHVPTGPMDLALQLEAGRGSAWSPAPSAATPAHVSLEVDWVVAYRKV